ncbi:MAG: hypothetical protein ACFFAO_08875 [Candidatus Hermodarchaeota archaeon]
MFIQELAGGYNLLVRDISFLINIAAMITLFFSSIQCGKKIKEGGKISASTGFTLFMLSFAFWFSILSAYDLYPEIFPIKFDNFDNYVHLTFLIGMFLLVFFIELDISRSHKSQKNSIFNFKLSIVVGITYIVLVPFMIMNTLDAVIIFILAVPPVFLANDQFIKEFKKLVIVEKAKPLPLLTFGLALAGLSNFLHQASDYNLLGNWVEILQNICVLVGGIMFTKGWRSLPSLTELDWMEKMEQLLVIHRDTSSVLYSYYFQDRESTKKYTDKDLAGSAIGGINILLREILASKGYLKEIDYEDKKVFFIHGRAIICVLIANDSSEEFLFRLNSFSLEFEKQYWESTLKDWEGELDSFQSSETLIKSNFIYTN